MILDHLTDYYRTPTSFNDLSYKSQLLQAKALELAISAHRLARPHCMGSLYWQLNDVWPGISWSTVDYYGRWKLGHYTAQKLYQAAVPLFKMNEDSVAVYCTNDTRRPLAGMAQLAIKTFEGNVLWEHTQPVEVQPGPAALLHSFSLNDPIIRGNRSNAYLEANIELENGDLLHNHCLFKKDKDLNFPISKIDTSWAYQDSVWVLSLESESLVRSVYLTEVANRDTVILLVKGKQVDAIPPRFTIANAQLGGNLFSENGFDLLPGQPKKIMVYSPAQRMPYTIEIRSLRQVY